MHPRVVDAVRRDLETGSNFIRPATIELAATERVLQTLSTAEMVRFAKNGFDATTAAGRLARAATGLSLAALCRDRPFFSTDGWFIGIARTCGRCR
jgi:glutamate-1-semialdehyde 2,1-aminomutase